MPKRSPPPGRSPAASHIAPSLDRYPRPSESRQDETVESKDSEPESEDENSSDESESNDDSWTPSFEKFSVSEVDRPDSAFPEGPSNSDSETVSDPSTSPGFSDTVVAETPGEADEKTERLKETDDPNTDVEPEADSESSSESHETGSFEEIKEGGDTTADVMTNGDAGSEEPSTPSENTDGSTPVENEDSSVGFDVVDSDPGNDKDDSPVLTHDDFDDVSIDGTTETDSVTGEQPTRSEDGEETTVGDGDCNTSGGDAESDTPEEVDIDDHNFTDDAESDAAFTDPDASETWGATGNTDEFDQTLHEEEPDQDDLGLGEGGEQTSKPNDSTPEVTVTGDESLTATELLDDSDTSSVNDDGLGDNDTSDEDTDDLGLGALGGDDTSESATDSDETDEVDDFFDEDVETDFDGIEIEGAPDDPDDIPSEIEETDTPEPETGTDPGTGTQTPGQSPSTGTTATNTNGSDTVGSTPENTISPDPESRESAATGTNTDPPVEHAHRVRTPEELLGGALGSIASSARTTGAVLYGIGFLGLRAVTTLAEIFAGFLTLIYLITMAATLVSPTLAPLHIVNSTTRTGIMFELTVAVIPMILIIFAVTISIDKYLFGGERHESDPSPTFERL